MAQSAVNLSAHWARQWRRDKNGWKVRICEVLLSEFHWICVYYRYLADCCTETFLNAENLIFD